MKRSMMSLTSRWMSQWMFIIGESVRCSYPKEFLTHVFNHRIVEKVVFTRCNSHGICHKDLKKPKAVDQSPQLLPRLLHTDDIEKNSSILPAAALSLWVWRPNIHERMISISIFSTKGCALVTACCKAIHVAILFYSRILTMWNIIIL